jgi:RNA polymerase sigma-70 factor (ECF subfamily)
MLAFVFNQPEAARQQRRANSTGRRVHATRTHTNEAQDNELLRRIAQRDRNAFARLYDRYAAALYSLCMAIVKRQDEAEDVIQECFLQIWEKAHAFDGLKGSVYTWLVTMTRNRAIDRLRSKHFQFSRQRRPDFDLEAIAADEVHSPLESTSLAERAHLVRQAFATLPVEQREVLQMAYFQGYSQSEISQQLRVPLGTVKTRTRQAMKKLHALLADCL